MPTNATPDLAEVQARVETLEAVIQASPLAILAVDPQGIVRMWNPRCEAVFGWTAEEAVGHPLPTVPEGKARIRTIMTSEHSRELIDIALEIIVSTAKKMGILA